MYLKESLEYTLLIYDCTEIYACIEVVAFINTVVAEKAFLMLAFRLHVYLFSF
jgi:hypothetical protein